MNEMQIFRSSEFGEIGVLEIDGKPYFPATACAKMLGYSNPRDAIRRHCKTEGVVKHDGVSHTTNQYGVRSEQTVQSNFISEGNLYRLIIGSKLPAAERFERWIFDEVLVEIRKKGTYGTTSALEPLCVIVEQLSKVSAALVTLTERFMSAAPAKEHKPLVKMDFYAANQCKLETFPAAITEQVDNMLTDMLDQQALNFSMIARFCTVNGYPITSPTVKKYFDRHFSKSAENTELTRRLRTLIDHYGIPPEMKADNPSSNDQSV